MLLFLAGALCLSAYCQDEQSRTSMKIMLIELTTDDGNIDVPSGVATSSVNALLAGWVPVTDPGGFVTEGYVTSRDITLMEERDKIEAERVVTNADSQAIEDALSAAQDDYNEALRLLIEMSRRQSEVANAIIRNLL